VKRPGTRKRGVAQMKKKEEDFQIQDRKKSRGIGKEATCKRVNASPKIRQYRGKEGALLLHSAVKS